MAETTSSKQACHGSCHCGLIQYVIYLIVPHPHSAANPPKPTGDQEIYRCNCSNCYKMNMFHIRPANPHDFMLLSPLDPDKELSAYSCNNGRQKFFFCPKCGVRCFTFGGMGETVEVDLEDVGEEKNGKRKVWRAQWDGDWDETTHPYVSINGVTIDWDQGFDLAVLTEEKRVQYFDGRSELKDEREARWDRPHYGGCY